MTSSKHNSILSRIVAFAALLLLFSPTLSAQNSGRGFVKAQAGTSFNNIGSSYSGGGGFGVRLTEYLDLFAEAGTIGDVMTPELQNELDAIATLAALEFQTPVELNATIPSQYGLIGARITIPVRSVVTPFFEIGGGAARYSLDLQTHIGGFNLTPLLREEFGEFVDARFMLSATAGAHLAVTNRLGFDFAYRYFRISTDSPSLAGSQLYAGIVYRF